MEGLVAIRWLMKVAAERRWFSFPATGTGMARRMRGRRSRSRSRKHSGVGSVQMSTGRVPQSRAVGLSPSAQTSGELAKTSGAAGNNTSSSAGNIIMYGLRNNFTLSCRFPHPSSVLHEATLKRA